MRRAERRSNRQDVRLSPGSFLQLLPAEVLMSLSGSECSIETEGKQTRALFLCNYYHIFYDAVEEQVAVQPLQKRVFCDMYIFSKYILSKKNTIKSLCKDGGDGLKMSHKVP